MPIPLLDLTAQYATIKAEIREAMDRVLDSQHFILGAEVEALEREIAAYSQCEFGIGVSSGTDALLLALMVIDIQPGDEVIMPTYTFFATAGVVARLQGKPVFIDSEPDTFNLNVDQLEAAITPRTRAIIPVHLFGQMANMPAIMDIAQRHNLIVIEDAAQAIGSEWQGQRAGAIGQMGCFSFFPSKNLGAFGDAGMVTTSDPDLVKKLKLYRNHGYQPKYFNQVIGGNFRLDALQAAVLRVKLKYLDGWTAARQRNAAHYRTLFANLTQVITPVEMPDTRHIYNQFVIRCERRDELLNYLKAHEIGAEVYYPLPMHLQACFHDLGYQAGDFPVSEQLSQTSLAIPIYPELTEDMQAQVVDVIRSFYKENQRATE